MHTTPYSTLTVYALIYFNRRPICIKRANRAPVEICRDSPKKACAGSGEAGVEKVECVAFRKYR